MQDLDIIIPVYNERPELVIETIENIHRAFNNYNNYQVIVVNDGSKNEYNLDTLAERTDIKYIKHIQNRGYGAALKTCIRAGNSPIIAITDADGTYPVADLPKLAEEMKDCDMVIGTRTTEVCHIPLLRRFPKKILNLTASYIAGEQIKDLNSGMRVFSRELCYYLWPFYPAGFSFTSTITMGSIMGGFRRKEIAIDYFKRDGDSSIHPIKDTIRFFRLVARLGLIFNPMKLFGPVSIFLFTIGFIKGFCRDFFLLGYVGNLSIMLILAALQVGMMGLLAKLIVHSRVVSPTKSNSFPSTSHVKKIETSSTTHHLQSIQ
ncbi:MAG: glycosyltransferase family 2 protein [Bdellovibrionales bacterium]|nr:glycosyltransferase family 2 protein [Bdellovibrionales bacterium]